MENDAKTKIDRFSFKLLNKKLEKEEREIRLKLLGLKRTSLTWIALLLSTVSTGLTAVVGSLSILNKLLDNHWILIMLFVAMISFSAIYVALSELNHEKREKRLEYEKALENLAEERIRIQLGIIDSPID